ncbi:peptidoglycan-binding protein [Streptomyces sp. V1I6]|uniref:peptidoglycan-binding domain-containing protein n=1 Tax=Streptomyces sp. V1I6 TaxID=3042273 RepID=UPI00278B1255|nr:peptidoglycan-binding domain-containing protein [Streptomyces sp. V1I6]MDQ0846104.1 peptidoglycan hydrolase-like protein with peptidoglycan-binding domain [Streptomyces sp. V1I6]
MRKILAAAAVLSGLATALAVTPAQAAVSKNSGAYSSSFVDGAGALTDDFGEQAGELGNSLCYGCGNSSNTDIVVLWQSILAAEDFLTLSEIDGQFGPGSRDATKAWQRRYGLTADGMVGDATWSKADDRLRWLSSSRVSYAASYQSGAVTFHRGDPDIAQDSGAYKVAEVYRYDHVKSMGGQRIEFNSLTIL